MRLSNYVCLLMSIVVTRAQDDNPSGHELHDHMFDNSLTTFSLDDSSTTFSLDDSSTTTTTATFDDNVSSANENMLGYNILLWGFLLL